MGVGYGWGWPYLAAAAFGVALAIALSAVIALPTAKLSGMYVMVLTLGLQITLERSIFGRNSLTGGGQVTQVNRPSIFGLSVDSDKAEAEFKNGMLYLRLPKAEAVRPKQIKVNSVNGSALTSGQS